MLFKCNVFIYNIAVLELLRVIWRLYYFLVTFSVKLAYYIKWKIYLTFKKWMFKWQLIVLFRVLVKRSTGQMIGGPGFSFSQLRLNIKILTKNKRKPKTKQRSRELWAPERMKQIPPTKRGLKRLHRDHNYSTDREWNRKWRTQQDFICGT